MKKGDAGAAAWHLVGAVPFLGPMTQEMSNDLIEGKWPEFLGHAAALKVMSNPESATRATEQVLTHPLETAARGVEAVRTGATKAGEAVKGAVSRIPPDLGARVGGSVGTGIGAYVGGAPGAIVGGEVGRGLGRSIFGPSKAAMELAAKLDDAAKSLTGQKFSDLPPDRQALVRNLVAQSEQPAVGTPAAAAAQPTMPEAPLPPQGPPKTITQMLDEELAARRAARTAGGRGGEGRVPVWQNPELTRPPVEPAETPPQPAPSNLAAIAETPAEAPPPVATPQLNELVAAAQRLLQRRGGAPAAVEPAPAAPPEGAPPTAAPPAPTVSPEVAEASRRFNEAAGTPPEAEQPPARDFEAEKRNEKAVAFAKYLHGEGAQAAHVADAIPLDNFWTQATQGVNQSGSRKWGAPSPATRPLIVAEMRKLEQALAAEVAPAAAPPAAAAAPPAAEPAAPVAEARAPASKYAIDFAQADALAKRIQGHGLTAEDAQALNPQQWKELGVESPAASRQVLNRLATLEKSQPIMQGLSDRLQSAADAATQRMRDRGSFSGTSLNSMPNPADLADIAIWGAAKLAQGTVKFGQWSKAMVNELGDQVKPHLEKLYADSQKIYDRHVKTTEGQMPATKELLKKFHEGESGADWYEKTREELERIFGPDAKLFSDFLAATTNNATVEANLAFALKAYKQYRLGQKWEGFMEDVKGQLDKALAGEQFGGMKVQSFQKNLWGEADPVTVDRWMHRAFGFRKSGITPGQYKFIDYQITQMANRLKMEPRQVQAAIWKAIKEAEQKAGNTSQSFEELLPDRIAKDPQMQALIERAKAGEAAPPRPKR